MNITDFRAVETLKPLVRPKLYWTLADALVMAKRHLVVFGKGACRGALDPSFMAMQCTF